MPKIFERTGTDKPRYSAFDLSHEQKLTCDMGELIPTYIQEIIPGDHFKVKTESLVRLAPMVAPMMHRCNLYLHYFFVPNRLLWADWEDFITGGKDGLSEPVMPSHTLGNIMLDSGSKRLADYLGLPSVEGTHNSTLKVTSLQAMAYQCVWNEYYRDPNLMDELDIQAITISNTLTDKYTLRQRCWEKDYFTSSLPWTQRGPTANIPVNIDQKYPPTLNGVGLQSSEILSVISNNQGEFNMKGHVSGSTVQALNVLDGLDIDVNELRRSMALQRFLEKQAKGGYRYVETLLSHFGVNGGDARLQRPEYLGGGRQPIVVSEVLNTSATTGTPLGDFAGHGIAVGQTNSFTKKFNEHGYVLGIMSVMPRSQYFQGVPRHFMRSDKYDYYWPTFARLGEQEVKNSEIFFNKNDDNYNNDTFGYQQRYAEYKYSDGNKIHGDFRNSLKHFHLARDFSSSQNLNSTFVECNPSKRVFATEYTDDNKLWIQLYHNVKARRPMPYFANPKL